MTRPSQNNPTPFLDHFPTPLLDPIVLGIPRQVGRDRDPIPLADGETPAQSFRPIVLQVTGDDTNHGIGISKGHPRSRSRLDAPRR